MFILFILLGLISNLKRHLVVIARLVVLKMSAKLLIHAEKSARFAALVKYCDCQNIDYNVLQSPLDNIYPADCDNLRCFLIILNENDIVR